MGVRVQVVKMFCIPSPHTIGLLGQGTYEGSELRATRIRRSEGRLALGLLLVVVCATLGEATVRVLHVPWRDIGWSMLT